MSQLCSFMTYVIACILKYWKGYSDAQLGFGSWIARTFNKVGTQAAELKNMMSWQTHTHSVASNSVKNDCLFVANLRFHTDFKSFGYQSIHVS